MIIPTDGPIFHFSSETFLYFIYYFFLYIFRSSHQTKLNENIHFKAPWEGPKPEKPRNTFAEPSRPIKPKKEKKSPPLFWSPTPGTALFPRDSNKSNNKTRNSVSSQARCSTMWNSRDQSSFRHLKHTPTFVDESLFGAKLQEPSFEAPWNERKKGEKKALKPYLWDPSGGPEISGHNGLEISLSGRNPRSGVRPATAIGIRNKGVAVPVWKP